MSSRRSITVPIVLASVAITLSITLLVGWTLLIVQKLEESQAAVASNVSILVLGIVSFVFIVTVLVLFSVFLVREVREVRRQESFIDSVTHELKSPLASIKLGVQTLGREQLDASKRAELREMIRQDIDRLSVFIDDVLQASRLTYGSEGFDSVELRLEPMVLRCAALIAERRGYEASVISVDMPADFAVWGDQAALEVILKNLIDNGIKYSGDSPKVEVRAYRESSRVYIEVRDHGIGISTQHRKRIFQRFFRVPTVSVRQRKGTGLGLFVVQSLVRNLGGKVSADSEGEGKGTTIRVRLPEPRSREADQRRG